MAKPGRPPRLEKQSKELALAVNDANKSFRSGLSRIGESFNDLADTAIQVALGGGEVTRRDKQGNYFQAKSEPSVPMLSKLLDIGIEALKQTGDSADSPSHQILETLRKAVSEGKMPIELTQVNNYYDTAAVLVADDGQRGTE